MAKPLEPAPLLGTLSQWAAIAICAALGFAVFAFVDLTPEIQADFFFSTDDPQLQKSLQIEREFGGTQQILVAARSERVVSSNYLLRLRALTQALRQIEGVEAWSLTHGPEELDPDQELDPEELFEDLADRPFSNRLLLAKDRSATFVVLSLEGEDHAAIVSAIDEVVARHTAPGFAIDVSGVPYVSEHVRRQLTDDLRLFSVAAFGEADRPWYSNFLPWEVIFERLESRDRGEVGRYFVSEDRHRGRFVLRMRELERTRPREVVIAEIEGLVRTSGFNPVLVGGLYPLADEMSELVEGSVIRGLGGLLGLFFVIVPIVTRSLGSALAMVSCLAITPFLLFGLGAFAECRSTSFPLRRPTSPFRSASTR